MFFGYPPDPVDRRSIKPLRLGFAGLTALACAACGSAKEAPSEPSPAAVERIVAQQESNLAADGEAALVAADERAKARAQADIKGLDDSEAERVEDRQ